MESRKESTEDEISFSDSANSSVPKWSRSDSVESLNTFDKSGVEFALPTRRIRPIPPVVIEVDEERNDAEESVEAPPDIDFYRKNTLNGRLKRARPSISDLIDGQIQSSNNEEHTEEQKKTEVVAKPTTKFGWIEGVFIRCLQNIIGVILFIRISWVAAHCGILLGSLLILLASSVTIVTTLSLSAICTNGEVKGGGLYYLISRTLGPEFGGSIGIMFAFGNAASGALYLVGMSETIVGILKAAGIVIVDGAINDIRIVAVVMAFILKSIILAGISFESLLQKLMLFPMVISILGFLAGSVMPISIDQAVKGATGWNLDTFFSNLLPRFEHGQSFFTVFAVYFPAATGIMAGANISGDLKNPQNAIPKGTMLAIIASTLIYLTVLIVSGSIFVRDADGISPAIPFSSLDTLPCAANATCPYGLYNYYQVMATISIWPPLIIIGILSATFSSALVSMVSAPKILQPYERKTNESQAVSADKLFPHISGLAKEYGRDRAPRRAYALTFVVTLLMAGIGDLNSIAPIISNFFLAAYTLVNYSCFDASFSGSPGFRPAFKYYSMYLSLFGALICIVIMFTMNWVTALITTTVFMMIFGFLKYRKPDVNWGSSMHANNYKQTLQGMYRLTKAEEHVKNYRPQILVLSSTSSTHLPIFAHSITRGASLIISATVDESSPSHRAHSHIRSWIDKEKHRLRAVGVKAFPLVMSSDEGWGKAAKSMMQTAGLGRLIPNIVLLGMKTDWIPVKKDEKPSDEKLKEINEYFTVVQSAFDRSLGVAILRNSRTENSVMTSTKLKPSLRKIASTNFLKSKSKVKPVEISADNLKQDTPGETSVPLPFSPIKGATIDVWWLADDGGLTLLIPHLLTLPKSYLAGAKLRVFSLTSDASREKDQEAAMAALLSKFRIDFKDLVIISDVSTEPSKETEEEFRSLIAPFRGEKHGMISDVLLKASTAKTRRNLRLAEMLREKSRDADLIVMTLPVPRKGIVCSTLYLAWLEMLTRGLPTTLLLRGNQTDLMAPLQVTSTSLNNQMIACDVLSSESFPDQVITGNGEKFEYRIESKYSSSLTQERYHNKRLFRKAKANVLEIQRNVINDLQRISNLLKTATFNVLQLEFDCTSEFAETIQFIPAFLEGRNLENVDVELSLDHWGSPFDVQGTRNMLLNFPMMKRFILDLSCSETVDDTVLFHNVSNTNHAELFNNYSMGSCSCTAQGILNAFEAVCKISAASKILHFYAPKSIVDELFSMNMSFRKDGKWQIIDDVTRTTMDFFDLPSYYIIKMYKTDVNGRCLARM